MSDRTALIISCSQEQAATIHRRALLEKRPVSGYVLRILMRVLDLEEHLSALQQKHDRHLSAYKPLQPPRAAERLHLLAQIKEVVQNLRGKPPRPQTGQVPASGRG